MDNTVILAVAGSGKTTHIINQLNLNNRSLIITYTLNNRDNLRKCIINKFGYFPNNITLMSYFTFLYTFCFRPFLSYKIKSKGINYEPNNNYYEPLHKKGTNKLNKKYFMDLNNRLYSNRIAKLLESLNSINDIKSRIEKYFDNLFIDEIQDFAGNDFDFIKNIADININLVFVGDFYQHTFDTSRDRSVNKNLHADYDKYKMEFSKIGFSIDKTTLKSSYRCSPTICSFISDKLEIDMISSKKSDSNIILIKSEEDAEKIFKNDSIVKLFLKEHYKYNCYSSNWGDCKGINHFIDVCVVLNKTTLENFRKNTLIKMPPQTKNKFYVACSRANNNLYFVPYNFYEKHKKKPQNK